MDFSEFNLHPDLLDGIETLKFKTATPIQEQAIPVILEGRDLIGVAQTGTGKTAAFMLPIINLILESGESNTTQVLIIVPTRELAVQIDQNIEAYSYFTGVSSMAIYGGGDGKSFTQEKSAITGGADIIVATPGRLIAHINLGYVDFSHVRHLILDEADRMLDMGFQPDLLKIVNVIPEKRQTLMFSATMPQHVVRFARTLLKNPVSISIAVSKPAENITQHVYMVPDQHKNALMTSLLKDKVGQRIIVFGSTRQSVTALYQRLKARNMSVGQISSDVEQDMREQIMLDFRNRKIDVLIATDVLSRGIDVDGIDVVVNFDVPRDPEDYVHRIGRTARAARSGLAITLVNSTDLPKFARIERFLDKKIEKLPLPEQFEGAMSLPPRKDSGDRSSRPGNNNKRPSRPPGNQPRKPQPVATTSPKPPTEIHPDADPVKDKKPRRRKRGNRKKEGDVAKVSNEE